MGPTAGYSCRSAWIGSTRAALRAGTTHATTMIMAKSTAAARNVNGSAPLIPATICPVTGRAASASPGPATSPPATPEPKRSE